MKIVICCGADRTGKSVLVGEFRRRGWNSIHFNPPKNPPNAYSEYREYADWLMTDGDPNGKYIIDRYMYCEFPYSKHYGRPTDMTIAKMREIEDDLLKLDPLATVIYCQTDIESNWKRLQDEGRGDFKDIGQLRALRNEYEKTLHESKLILINYDFTKGDTPAMTADAVESLGGKIK